MLKTIHILYLSGAIEAALLVYYMVQITRASYYISVLQKNLKKLRVKPHSEGKLAAIDIRSYSIMRNLSFVGVIACLNPILAFIIYQFLLNK
jgi:uncharacterized protein YxeA